MAFTQYANTLVHTNCLTKVGVIWWQSDIGRLNGRLMDNTPMLCYRFAYVKASCNLALLQVERQIPFNNVKNHREKHIYLLLCVDGLFGLFSPSGDDKPSVLLASPSGLFVWVSVPLKSRSHVRWTLPVSRIVPSFSSPWLWSRLNLEAISEPELRKLYLGLHQLSLHLPQAGTHSGRGQRSHQWHLGGLHTSNTC